MFIFDIQGMISDVEVMLCRYLLVGVLTWREAYLQPGREMCLRYHPTLGPDPVLPVVARARSVTSLSEAGRGPLCGLLACLPTCLPSA